MVYSHNAPRFYQVLKGMLGLPDDAAEPGYFSSNLVRASPYLFPGVANDYPVHGHESRTHVDSPGCASQVWVHLLNSLYFEPSFP